MTAGITTLIDTLAARPWFKAVDAANLAKAVAPVWVGKGKDATVVAHGRLSGWMKAVPGRPDLRLEKAEDPVGGVRFRLVNKSGPAWVFSGVASPSAIRNVEAVLLATWKIGAGHTAKDLAQDFPGWDATLMSAAILRRWQRDGIPGRPDLRLIYTSFSADVDRPAMLGLVRHRARGFWTLEETASDSHTPRVSDPLPPEKDGPADSIALKEHTRLRLGLERQIGDLTARVEDLAARLAEAREEKEAAEADRQVALRSEEKARADRDDARTAAARYRKVTLGLLGMIADKQRQTSGEIAALLMEVL